jgi:hypothetical protein
MNNRIDFTNLGGFPFQQDTLDFMQLSYREAFKAMAALCGDKAILTGVDVAGGLVSNGWISYGGELIPFVGGAVGLQVVITETRAVTQSVFNDGVARDVYFTKIASCGAIGSFLFSDLKKIKTLVTATSYNDLTDVPAESAVNYNDLANLPAAKITYKESVAVGDVGAGLWAVNGDNNIQTIIIPDQGDANYIVAGSLLGLNADATYDDEVIWIVTAKTNTQFNLALKQVDSRVQNLKFEFAIIK